MQRHDAYTQTVHIGGASPRETEMLAFGLCNARLKSAADARSRIDALNKTHQLWSLLVRDLAGSANRFPSELKKQLVDIGFWAMGFSVSAMGCERSLQPLIEVNQNIIDGLKMQQKEQSTPSLTIQRASFSAAQV
jgi:flagellar protein FlaF